MGGVDDGAFTRSSRGRPETGPANHVASAAEI